MGLDPVGPDDYADGDGAEALEAPEPEPVVA